MPDLTDRQQEFVDAYVAENNIKAAADAADYSYGYARRLVGKPHVKTAIEEAAQRRRERFVESCSLQISPALRSALDEHFETIEDAAKAVERVILALIEKESAVRLRSRGRITGDTRYDVLYRANFRCQACGVAASDGEDVRLEVDHIVPKSWGGSDDLDNLQVLCAACNTSKSNRYAYDHNHNQLRLPFQECLS